MFRSLTSEQTGLTHGSGPGVKPTRSPIMDSEAGLEPMGLKIASPDGRDLSLSCIELPFK